MTKPDLRVLSLGAGVQSSTLALMAARGDIDPLDCAIFADTGWESERVYAWLDWLETQLTFPVFRVRRDGADLGELWLQVARGERSLSGAPLPGVFLKPNGMAPFYCSKEFKTRVIQKQIRKMLGLSAKERAPKGIYVESILGISYEEMKRMKDSEVSYIKNRFPLVEMRMRRSDCLRWMAARQYREPPRSSCIFCPFRTDFEWKLLRDQEPEDFERAVEFDRQIRPGWEGLVGEAYLHSSLRPLGEVIFNEDLFGWGKLQECEGACGT